MRISNEHFLFRVLRRDQFSLLKNIKARELFPISLCTCVHLSDDFEKSGRHFDSAISPSRTTELKTWRILKLDKVCTIVEYSLIYSKCIRMSSYLNFQSFPIVKKSLPGILFDFCLPLLARWKIYAFRSIIAKIENNEFNIRKLFAREYSGRHKSDYIDVLDTFVRRMSLYRIDWTT